MDIREMWEKIKIWYAENAIWKYVVLIILAVLLGVFVWQNVQNLALISLAGAMFWGMKKSKPTIEDQLRSKADTAAQLLFQSAERFTQIYGLIKPNCYSDMLHRPLLSRRKNTPCIILTFLKKDTSILSRGSLRFIECTADAVLSSEFKLLQIDDGGDCILIAVTLPELYKGVEDDNRDWY